MAKRTGKEPSASLSAAEQDTLKHLIIREPIDRFGWIESPREINVVVDHQRLDRRHYAVNLTFMDRVKNTVTAGRVEVNGVFQEGLSEHADRWVRPSDDQGIAPSAHSLYLLPEHDASWPPGYAPDAVTSIHYSLVPPNDGSVVIQTETTISAGSGKLWGVVPSELQGRPLSWEMRVVICDQHKQLLPADRFSAAPPVIAFAHSSMEPVKYSSKDATHCYSTVTAFYSQPRGGDVLYIEVPEAFGDAHVRVNFKIR